MMPKNMKPSKTWVNELEINYKPKRAKKIL